MEQKVCVRNCTVAQPLTLIEDVMLQLYLDAMEAVFETADNTDVVSFALPSCKSHK